MRAWRWPTTPTAAWRAGRAVGPLHGLPIAFKEMESARRLSVDQWVHRSIKDRMPPADTVLVERLRQAGVIPIGKTNVPEFGMGSQTYNAVYGTTRQPLRPHEDSRGFERRRRCGACRRPAAAG